MLLLGVVKLIIVLSKGEDCSGVTVLMVMSL